MKQKIKEKLKKFFTDPFIYAVIIFLFIIGSLEWWPHTPTVKTEKELTGFSLNTASNGEMSVFF